MNKVMNNFKRLGNSTLNEIENENVKILDHLKIQKGQFLLPFFFTLNKIRTLGMKVLRVFFIKNYCNVCRMNLKKKFPKSNLNRFDINDIVSHWVFLSI